jgi:membrane protein DedA with SNARE-associated domain
MVGMSSVPTVTFVILNCLGALLWAAVTGSGGYLFGRALKAVLGKVETYEIAVVGGIALAGFLIWLIHGIHLRRK